MPDAARLGDQMAHGGTIGPTVTGMTVLIGNQPAATMGDPHVCPVSDGPKPHVGGTILKGSASVKICNKPAARVGDTAECKGPPNTISKGEMTVQIGDAGGGGGGGGGAGDGGGGGGGGGDGGGGEDEASTTTATDTGGEIESTSIESGGAASGGSGQSEQPEQPPKTGDLVVTVTDQSNNQPITGAPVTLNGPSAPQPGTTDNQGEAKFAGLKLGSYQLRASKQGYKSGTGSASVAEGANNTAAVRLQPAAQLEGKVVDDKDDHPINGAKVKLSGGAVNRTATTDPQGRFQFADLDAKTYQVRAEATGYTARQQSVQLKAGQTEQVELRLSACPVDVHNLPKTHYSKDRDHFDLELVKDQLKITSDIEFVKGWAGEVVKLGASVPAGTGGLLDGQLTWSGYRWMKQVGLGKQYWDGSAWKALPATFVLADSNNFAVGFYKVSGGSGGDKFRCQYGGTWPESFTDWNIDDPAKKAVLQTWVQAIHDKWTGKFDIKRKSCPGGDKHCRYSTTADAKLTRKDSFTKGMLIVSDGQIRANDSLWFMNMAVSSVPHEFGHHLGNPDEYAGASSLDPTLNEDNIVNGIDATSVMGQTKDKVYKRHYRTICAHFATMVKKSTGQTYTYEAVPPPGGP